MNNNVTSNSNKNNNDEFWNQYLAGLIDGDGSLLISKAGFASLEISMDIFDFHALNKVKQKLGGSIKLRGNINAYRYRLHNKNGILDLLIRINGKIRQTKRVQQLQKMCYQYNIPFKFSEKLTNENAWFAGFFDADGTIGYSMKNNYPQLIISVSQKSSVDLIPFQNIFGGFIRFDKASNTWKWDIYSQNDILNFYYYCRKFSLHSHKKRRIFLIPIFYKLRSAKAYREDSPILLKKTWLRFEQKWNTF